LGVPVSARFTWAFRPEAAINSSASNHVVLMRSVLFIVIVFFKRSNAKIIGLTDKSQLKA
jgi:hypothetical protein